MDSKPDRAFFKQKVALIQSQGGTVQMIPARKVQTVEPLGRSLMLSADQLGLSAQDLADVMAYLKGLN